MRRPASMICLHKVRIFLMGFDPTDHGLCTEYFSPFSSATGQYFATVFGGHPQAEAMGVLTGSV